MTAAEPDRYADVRDPALVDALRAEDAHDDAAHRIGMPGPTRDTCYGCRDWADHSHDATSGARVDLSDAELNDLVDRTAQRAVLSDMAHDSDDAAWGLYGRLARVAENRAAAATAVVREGGPVA